MLDELVVEDLEAQLVAGLDSVCCCVACGGTLVAAKVVAVHQLGREGRHICVAVLANVGILATDVGTVDNKPVEDVVRIGWREQREEGKGLHTEANRG